MTTIASTFKNAGRALLVAAVLGTGGLAAAPAVAQDPSFNFSLGIGGNGQPSFGFGINSNRNPPGFRRPSATACLSDRQVIAGLRSYGFSRVQIVDSNRRNAEATGRYQRADYDIYVNKCTGQVDIDRIRRGPPSRPGFGLQFNFGN